MRKRKHNRSHLDTAAAAYATGVAATLAIELVTLVAAFALNAAAESTSNTAPFDVATFAKTVIVVVAVVLQIPCLAVAAILKIQAARTTRKKVDTMLDITTFGRVLRETRKRQNLTQRDLATRAGISPTTLANYEKGRTAPTLDSMLRIADALGVHLSYVLQIAENRAYAAATRKK